MSTSDALVAHLGWRPFQHRDGCARPVWEVDQQAETDARRDRRGGGHSCPAEDCGHHDHYDKVTVRLLCRSCAMVHLISGEERSSTMTTTASTGYGQPPKKTGGLWLYPGPPLLHWPSAGPSGYLCSRKHVERLAPEDVVGALGEGRGPRGAVTWSAGALPTWKPSVTGSGTFPLPTWTKGADAQFRTVAAAAKWVKAQVDAAGAGKEEPAQ